MVQEEGLEFNKSIDHIRRIDLEKDRLENVVIEIAVNKSHTFLVAKTKSSKYFPNNNNEHLVWVYTNYLSSKDNKNVERSLETTWFYTTQLIKQPTRVAMNTSTLIEIISTNN